MAARDERDGIIKSHHDLVEDFERAVWRFHDDIRKIEQTRTIFAKEIAGLQSELDLNETESDYLQRRLECGEIDVSSLKDALARLTKDYSDTDTEFNRYTDKLRLNLRNQDFIINNLLKNFSTRQNEISDLNNEVERQKSHVDHYQNELTKIEQIEYEKKFTQLSGDLRKAEDFRKGHQDELENAHGDLTTKFNLWADNLAEKQRERDEQAQKINDTLDKIKETSGTINDLLNQLENIENKIRTDINRDVVLDQLNRERESIDNKLRFATDELNKLRGELDDAIRNMNDNNDLVEEQRRQIDALRKDIDELRKLIEEKKKIITQLEIDIQLAIEEIERLKKIIEDLDRRIKLLRDQIAERDAEILKLQAMLDERLRRIEWLTNQIGEGPPPEITYKAAKGDLVDEMLAKYIQNCPVPVKRLGGGFYLFGTRKIYAKIMNGKLVIRVGGGYMIIEKFIETYADQELIKINSILEREGLTSIDQLDLEEYCLNRNRTSYGNVVGESSPNNRSGKFNASGSKKKTMNGTGRSPKTVTAAQLEKARKL